MLQALRNIWDIPDLRKRVLFTLGLLAVYRLGNHVPTPGITAQALIDFFEQNRGNWFGLVDMFSGGNLAKVTVFALGIMPYITASIILQLLTVVFPHLEKLKKEGELGRRKITQYTRYLTVAISMFQATAISMALQRATTAGTPLVTHPGTGFIIQTVVTLTTGAVFVMWLGEQITARGIGNGMSLLIFAGIVVGLPRAINNIYQKVFIDRTWSYPVVFLLLAFMVAIIAFIVMVERGERRIQIQYARRIVGRKVVGGVSTHLPLKVNSSGVMPIIFAVSILTFPQTIGLFVSKTNVIGKYIQRFAELFAWGEPLYTLTYVILIMFFAHFYLSIVYNPDEVADNV